jgi:hypothetical protein
VKYLEALRRAADWLVTAMVRTGPTRGWAEQYDLANQPCWARHMEPPAVSMTAIEYAIPRLLLLYDITGDAKYRRPVDECVHWGKSLPESRRGWLYYDLQSGEPIMAYNHRVFSVHSEEFKQQFPKFSAHFSSGHASYPFDAYQALLDRRQPGPVFPSWKGTMPRTAFAASKPTREELRPRSHFMPGALKALEDWQAGRIGSIIMNVDEYAAMMLNLSNGADSAAQLLDGITIRRAALGDVPVEVVPRYSRAAIGNPALIDSGGDWYDVPLKTRP